MKKRTSTPIDQFGRRLRNLRISVVDRCNYCKRIEAVEQVAGGSTLSLG